MFCGRVEACRAIDVSSLDPADPLTQRTIANELVHPLTQRSDVLDLTKDSFPGSVDHEPLILVECASFLDRLA